MSCTSACVGSQASAGFESAPRLKRVVGAALADGRERGVRWYGCPRGGEPEALPIVVNQLTAFSSFGLASQKFSTTALYGLSWGIGANAALANEALSAATEGSSSSAA